jgi:hypothetical protein
MPQPEQPLRVRVLRTRPSCPATEIFTLAWFDRCIYRRLVTLETVLNALTPKELKQELIAKGFLVLRSDARRVVLATRERENLIMDSGVWIEFEPEDELLAHETRFVIGCAVRSQHSDNRGESPHAGQERARVVALGFAPFGYSETGVRSVEVKSPSAPTQTLDTWQEVLLAKSDVRLADLPAELKTVLGLPKIAS